jgi:hypothetical protein
MKRVIIFVEGQTEEAFVRNVLYKEFMLTKNIWLDPRVIMMGRSKGGLSNYAKVRWQIVKQCKADTQVIVTTMFDLYALPSSFPGFQSSQDTDVYSRVRSLEAAFWDDIDHTNFIPYLQLHEFEALLFSDVQVLNDYVAMDSTNPEKTLGQLKAITKEFENPELINDSPLTAPSKRLMDIFAEQYNKVEHGGVVAEEIGLHTMRAKCSHFNDWLTKLESL